MLTKLGKAFAMSPAVSMLLQPLSTVAQPTQPPQAWDWPGHWHMMWGGGWGFWWIFPLFMLFMIVMCVFFMMRGPWGHGHQSGRDATTSALQILNERFAKGEISKEEFEEKRSILARRA